MDDLLDITINNKGLWDSIISEKPILEISDYKYYTIFVLKQTGVPQNSSNNLQLISNFPSTKHMLHYIKD